MKQPQKGFSLIELLTTICIIVILVTFVLPGLHSARKQSRSTLCKYNLQQMGVFLSIYRNDNDCELPYELESPYRPWPELLRQGHYLGNISQSLQNNYYGTIFDCPSRDNDGSIEYAEYSLNSNIHGVNIRKIEVPNPGSIASIGDGAYTPILPTLVGEFPLDYRHYGRVNILFLDRHVEERICVEYNEIVPEGISSYDSTSAP